MVGTRQHDQYISKSRTVRSSNRNSKFLASHSARNICEFSSAVDGRGSKRLGKAPFTPDPARSLEQTIVPGDPLRVMLSGLVEHTLPGPLHDVGIIHITPIRNPAPKVDAANGGMNKPSDALPNIGRFSILTTWKPNEPIELKDVLYPGGPMGIDERIGDLANAIEARYQEPFIEATLRNQINQFGQITTDRRQLFWTCSVCTTCCNHQTISPIHRRM